MFMKNVKGKKKNAHQTRRGGMKSEKSHQEASGWLVRSDSQTGELFNTAPSELGSHLSVASSSRHSDTSAVAPPPLSPLKRRLIGRVTFLHAWPTHTGAFPNTFKWLQTRGRKSSAWQSLKFNLEMKWLFFFAVNIRKNYYYWCILHSQMGWQR